MQYQLQYMICSIIIGVIALATHLMRRKTQEWHNRIFTLLVCTTLSDSIVNMIGTMSKMKPGMMSQPVMELFDYTHFLLVNVLAFIFMLYTIALVKNEIKTLSVWNKIFLYAPETIMFLLIISNVWTSAMFQYVDGVYSRGKYQIVLYLLNFYYIVFGTIYVVREKEDSTNAVRVSILSFAVIGIVSALLQLFQPELLLQQFGIALYEVVILLNLQKPEEYYNSDFGIYNRRIFEKLVRQNIQGEKKTNVLMISIENLNFIVQNFGVDSRKEILFQVAAFLDDISRQNVYYYNTDMFAIMYTGGDGTRTEKYIEEINQRFRQKWSCKTGDYFTDYKMMYYTVPDDVKDLDTMFFCNSTFVDLVEDQRHLVSIGDIDISRSERLNNIFRDFIIPNHFRNRILSTM